MTLSEAALKIGTTPDNLRGAILRGTLKSSPDSPRDLKGRVIVHLLEPEEVERYASDVAGKFGRKPNTAKTGSDSSNLSPTPSKPKRSGSS